MRFGIWGLGVWGWGLWVVGWEFMAEGLGVRVEGLRYRGQVLTDGTPPILDPRARLQKRKGQGRTDTPARGQRLFHQKYIYLTQLNLGHDVVKIWSPYPPNLVGTKTSYFIVWQFPFSERGARSIVESTTRRTTKVSFGMKSGVFRDQILRHIRP